MSFSGVPRWEGMSEGVPSKFRGHLCGVFWGALRCWGAAVLGCLWCWGIEVQVYQDNRVLGCPGYRVLGFWGVEVAGIWDYWGWILEFGGA